jgi:hypothetical protein
MPAAFASQPLPELGRRTTLPRGSGIIARMQHDCLGNAVRAVNPATLRALLPGSNIAQARAPATFGVRFGYKYDPDSSHFSVVHVLDCFSDATCIAPPGARRNRRLAGAAPGLRVG